MRPNNSRLTAQWALVSWLFSLLTLETLDSVAMFAGGLAAALIEEAATWLVHGGALTFVLAADTYFLLSRTFVHTTLTFSSTLLSIMRTHVVSLAWGLVVGAAVIDSGPTFDTRLLAPDFWDPTTLWQFWSDFVMSPTYFFASVMLIISGLIFLTKTTPTTCWSMRILWRFPLYHCCGNQFCSCQGGVVVGVVVVVVVVVYNLVAMLLLISTFSPSSTFQT